MLTRRTNRAITLRAHITGYMAAGAVAAIALAAPYNLQAQVQPQPSTVLIEEGTGNWCGYCPGGARTLAQLRANLGERAIVIAYHGGRSNEPMRTDAGQAIIDRLGIEGYPQAAIGRRMFEGKSAPMLNTAEWEPYAADVLDESSTAPLRIDVTDLSVTGGVVRGTARVTVVSPIVLGSGLSLALNVVTTEDSVENTQVEYTDNGTVVHQSWQNMHVARAIFPNYLGQALTLGSNTPAGTMLQVGESASVPFSFDGNVEMVERGNLVVIVHARTASALAPVFHAVEVPLVSKQSGVAIHRVAANGASISLVRPNPASADASITYTLPATAHVAITMYSMLGEHVATVADQQADAGTHVVPVSVSGLANGSYMVVMNADGQLTRTTLVVAR